MGCGPLCLSGLCGGPAWGLDLAALVDVVNVSALGVQGIGPEAPTLARCGLLCFGHVQRLLVVVSVISNL